MSDEGACGISSTTQNPEDPEDSSAVARAIPFIEKKPPKPLNMSPGAIKLRSWLNKSLRIQMFDGRILIGIFLCTDRDANVILGSCTEYLPVVESGSDETTEEPRMLGLVMVPGKHIESVAIDQIQLDYESGINRESRDEVSTSLPLPKNVDLAEIT